jgi:hypothetical protein
VIRYYPVWTFLICAAFAALTLLPGLASAEGFYADVHGGATFFDDEPARIASLVTQTSVHGHTNYDVGWLAGTSAGYEWQKKGFAAELEFTFRQNHINRIATSDSLFHGTCIVSRICSTGTIVFTTRRRLHRISGVALGSRCCP